jgi:hypothetical protein
VPERVQLSRRKGYRKPDGAIVVARPTRWGNPFTAANILANDEAVDIEDARDEAADYYRLWLTTPVRVEENDAFIDRRAWVLDHLHELAGRDLACWCPLDQPCHADILLALANDETVHRCPIDGEFLTPCCDRTTFELPATDRLTVHDVLVNCTRSYFWMVVDPDGYERCFGTKAEALGYINDWSAVPAGGEAGTDA